MDKRVCTSTCQKPLLVESIASLALVSIRYMWDPRGVFCKNDSQSTKKYEKVGARATQILYKQL